MKIRRIVSFTARGTRLTEFINAVHESDIICISQRCSRGEYSGKIYYTDLEKLKKEALKYRIDMYLEQYNSGVYKVMRYRARYGIVIGMVFTAFFILAMSNIALRIEVNGNSYVSDSEILEALEDNGIKHGAFIPFLDLSLAEFEVKRAIEDLTWIAIRNRGGKIIVDVKEFEHNEGSVHSNIPCNIVSVRDAQIVSVRLHRGQCEVAEGSAVAKGDVLISGIQVNDQNDFTVAHAEGEIIGDYVEKEKFIRFFESEKKEYTKKIRKSYLDFFGFRIPLFIGNRRDFNADYSEKTDFFTVFDHELPIGIVSAQYDVYDFVTSVDTEERTAEYLEEQIYLYEKNFFEMCEIIDRKIEKQKYDDRLEYDVTYVVRGSIGTEKPVFPGKKENRSED